MPAITISAVIGAVTTVATIGFNAILDLIQRFGFVAYWLVMVSILFADMNGLIPFANMFFLDTGGAGNFFGTIVSTFTGVFGLALSSTVLFALVLFSGLVWFLWKSKQGLQ